MTERELDQILTLEWPRVIRAVMAEDQDEWLKGFVLSIARQGKRQSWTPSPKQAALMRQMLNELRQRDEDCEVIE